MSMLRSRLLEFPISYAILSAAVRTNRQPSAGCRRLDASAHIADVQGFPCFLLKQSDEIMPSARLGAKTVFGLFSGIPWRDAVRANKRSPGPPSDVFQSHLFVLIETN
jgi:hypothetical protein